MYGSMHGTTELECVNGDETGGSITRLMQRSTAAISLCRAFNGVNRRSASSNDHVPVHANVEQGRMPSGSLRAYSTSDRLTVRYVAGVLG
jgi:hypothetical protein